MAFIDGTVVTVALPVLQEAFHTGVAEVQWIIEAYSLFLASLLLVGGVSGDRYGHRRVYIAGILIFTVASVLCGLSTDVHQLITFRAVQGIGGAFLVPGSLAIISVSFPEGERGRAIGTWSGFTSITAALGPVLGGWLAEHASWRWIFFLNVPLAVMVLGMAFRRVKDNPKGNGGHLDWPGALLATTALGALIYGLIASSVKGWRDPAVMGGVAGGCLLFVVFLLVEKRTARPMLQLELFRSPTFSGANLLTFFLYAALSGVLFFLPFLLIQVHGYPPTAAGASLLPFILIMFLLSRWAGGLVSRYGPRLPLMIGPLTAGMGFALFLLPGTSGSYWTTFFPAVVVLGFGMAVSVAPLTTTVMNAAGKDHAGTASGINNAVSRVGGLISIAVFGVLLAQVFASQLEHRLERLETQPGIREHILDQRVRLAGIELPPGLYPAQAASLKAAISGSYVAGFRSVMAAAVVLAFLSAWSSWFFIGRNQRNRGVHDPRAQ
jgi:EmrB/QacA subfamily drug resistance transporter